MAVFCEFFEHSNFAGDSVSYIADNNWRYHWVKFGSALGNEITSLRANAYSGTGGNVYGFSERDFLGSFASLNMAQGWTCWWSNVGGAMNDDIESALLVNRNSNGVKPMDLSQMERAQQMQREAATEAAELAAQTLV